MIKKIVTLILVTISLNSMAFECFGPDKYEWSIKKNFDLAESVFFAQVISGSAIPGDSQVKFKVIVQLPVKGEIYGEMELTTGKSHMYPSIQLFGNYLVFLYGDNKIEMCDPMYNVEFEIDSIEKLDMLSKRDDIELSKLFTEISTYVK